MLPKWDRVLSALTDIDARAEEPAFKQLFGVEVVKAHPGLAEAYLAAVKRPMDLGTLRRLCEAGSVSDDAEFVLLLSTVWLNCFAFNKPANKQLASRSIYQTRALTLQGKMCELLRAEGLPLPLPATVDDILLPGAHEERLYWRDVEAFPCTGVDTAKKRKRAGRSTPPPDAKRSRRAATATPPPPPPPPPAPKPSVLPAEVRRLVDADEAWWAGGGSSPADLSLQVRILEELSQEAVRAHAGAPAQSAQRAQIATEVRCYKSYAERLNAKLADTPEWEARRHSDTLSACAL